MILIELNLKDPVGQLYCSQISTLITTLVSSAKPVERRRYDCADMVLVTIEWASAAWLWYPIMRITHHTIRRLLRCPMRNDFTT